MSCFKNYGFGLGFRPNHFNDIIKDQKRVDWFEAVTENFLGLAGCGQSVLLKQLEHLRRDYPIALHSVSLNLGSADGVDQNFLIQLRDLKNRIEPMWLSDHLCFTGVDDINSHDLLPVPFTPESLDVIVSNIQSVQDFIGEAILVENVSSYFTYQVSTIPEHEFLTTVAERSGCGLLLDINNIFVTSQNHKTDSDNYIDSLPQFLIGQLHFAGHRIEADGLRVDTHDQPIATEVIELYRRHLKKLQGISTMVEWDANLPNWSAYVAELDRVRSCITTQPKLEFQL